MGSGRVLEMWDPGEYREGKIRASTRKGRIRASIGNGGSGRVPEMWDLREYLRRIGEGVESGQVPENHQIKKG